jgi:hypothetical protein
MASSPEMEANGDGITSKTDLAASTNITVGLSKSSSGQSPSLWEQAVRLVLFVVWFNTTCLVIVATQLFGVPLAFYDKNIFYAYCSWKMTLITI